MLQWIQALLGDGPWLVPVLWIVALIVVLFFVIRTIRRAWPVFVQFVVTVNSITELPAFMTRTDASIQALTKQVENSHKTNLRDDITDAQKTVKRVERGVRGVHTKLVAMQTEISKLRDSDIAAEERFDAIEKTIPRNELGQFTKPKEP